MPRARSFLIVETAIVLVAELVNATALGAIPLWNRLAFGVAAFAYVAYGFARPRSLRGRIAVLAVNAIALAALCALSGIAALLTVLLATRALELRPGDRRTFGICVALGIALFAASYWVGVRIEHRPAEIFLLVGLIPLYGLALALCVMLEDLLRSRRQLGAANAELAMRAARSEEIATAAERYRIGRDLQGELGRGLELITEQLETAIDRRRSDPHGSDVAIFRAQRTTALVRAALRRVGEGYRDAPAPGYDLALRLRDLARTFGDATGLAIRTSVAGVDVSDPVVAGALDRIAREALINVARHSSADNVTVALEATGDGARLTITDDGVGFHPGLVRRGAGLATIRERAREIGASCAIESAPAGGTTVSVSVPRGALRGD